MEHRTSNHRHGSADEHSSSVSTLYPLNSAPINITHSTGQGIDLSERQVANLQAPHPVKRKLSDSENKKTRTANKKQIIDLAGEPSVVESFHGKDASTPQHTRISSRSHNHSLRVKMAEKSGTKKTFQCMHCPCIYFDRTGLYRHMHRMHPDEANRAKSQTNPKGSVNLAIDTAPNTVTQELVPRAQTTYETTDNLPPTSSATSTVTTQLTSTDNQPATILMCTPHTSSAIVTTELPNTTPVRSELSLIASDSTINLLLTSTTADQTIGPPSTLGTGTTRGAPCVVGLNSLETLTTAVADVFTRHGRDEHLWNLPPSLLTPDESTNRWANELTLQVLKTTARYAASRLRHLLVEEIANGNANDLRKIASFCINLERAGKD